MLASAIIVFREVIEAGIIVGIVLAVTRGVRWRTLMVLAGLAAGICGSLLVAAFAGVLSNAIAGTGQELFNAALLSTAVCMLAWHNVWMAVHGREIASEMRKVGAEIASGSRSLTALGIVIAIAVLREGSEIVLFLYGIAVSEAASLADLAAGAGLGLLLGSGLSTLTYWGLVAIPPRYLFAVTGLLITFLAAGMAAQAVTFLAQAGYVTVLGQTVWDTSSIIPDGGILGRVLHALFGYVDQPTALQLAAYIGTAGAMIIMSSYVSRQQSAARRLAQGPQAQPGRPYRA